CQHYYSTPDSF
nr:immunoglobulin light chain junction region [Macaca mulatta]MPN91121.1 immunoglobulin light chain junction region [Macaca mulatta]MPN91146.1 immunoglobulin light chain junction region [Macaca mulatta]MPN91390.1 immunoglobulin light chain junction region [Macaca mulatta]MPN91448.1 immunoglobulin light chain junction region [Macaca mulatta]